MLTVYISGLEKNFPDPKIFCHFRKIKKTTSNAYISVHMKQNLSLTSETKRSSYDLHLAK